MPIYKSPVAQANSMERKALSPEKQKEIDEYLEGIYFADDDEDADDDDRYAFDSYSFKDINEALEDGIEDVSWDDLVDHHINYLGARGLSKENIKPLMGIDELRNYVKKARK